MKGVDLSVKVRNFRYFIMTRRSLAIALILTAAIIVSMIALGSNVTISAASSSKQLPIYCAPSDKKQVSLSFDAAWGNEDTEQLIEILKRYNVKATFFIVGEWVDKYPESGKALSDAGHDIMNHSDTHPDMISLSREKMVEQIKNCNDKIEKITGKRPTLFRAPYGSYNNTLIEVLKSQGMYCIQWDVDSLDWKDYSADKIFNRVTSKVKNGSICLFHNAALNTPEALPRIIEKLQSDGYSLVPVSEILCKSEFTLDHEGRQIPVTTATESLPTSFSITVTSTAQ